MEDSVTYQATIRRGEIKQARKDIISLGTKRFQAPPEDVRQRVEGIADLDRLERLHGRVLDASSWEDLPAGEGPAGG